MSIKLDGKAIAQTYRGVRDIPIPDKDYISFIKQYQRTPERASMSFLGISEAPMGLTEMRRIWGKARAKITAFFEDEQNSKYKEHEFLLTFRLLRHTFCTGLYDAGVDELSAAELMRYDVKIMREVYTHIRNGRRQKTVKKVGSLYKGSKIIG